MRRRTLLAILGFLPTLLWLATPWSTAGNVLPNARLVSLSFPSRPVLACPVSRPTADTTPGLSAPPVPGYFGHDGLWTTLWPQGRVVFEPGGPGFVLPDGSMGMKWPWIPLVDGELSVEGMRLDGAAPPLKFDNKGLAITSGGERFFPTYLIFSTPGCWEVTGRLGDTAVTFITLVIKVGDGPNWRPESIP